jgi:hypothetical protein
MKETTLWAAALLLTVLLPLGCTTPTALEISPDDVVLKKKNESIRLQATVRDQDAREMSTKGLQISWSTDDSNVITVDQDGLVIAQASGDAEVKAEIAETDIKAKATVEVQIPLAVKASKEKLRLWVGETKIDVWADVRTERGTPIEGLLPTWSSENSSIVKVEPVQTDRTRQSMVKMTGVAPGTTRITARHENLTASVRISVFGEGDEVQMVGSQISKKKARDAKRYKKKKKEKPRRLEF